MAEFFGTPRGFPLEFFNENYLKDTNECILWPYAISDNGYGQLMIGGRRVHVHSEALRRIKGDPPEEGMRAAHVGCNTKCCFNPKHLEWRTHKQIMELSGQRIQARKLQFQKEITEFKDSMEEVG